MKIIKKTKNRKLIRTEFKITTKAQFDRLVKLIENNSTIFKGKQKFDITKNQCKEAWEGFHLQKSPANDSV